MSSKIKRVVLWNVCLFNFVFHLIILFLVHLYSTGIINLQNFGITEYVFDYTPRIFFAVILFLISLIIYIKGRYYKDLNKVLILFLLTISLLLDTVGNFWGLYDVEGILGVFWYDDVLHFIIPILIAISVLRYLYNIKGYSKRGSLILSSTISLSLSMLWEIYEYWCDELFGTEMVRGLADTMSDLTFAFLGVCLFYILFSIVLKEE